MKSQRNEHNTYKNSYVYGTIGVVAIGAAAAFVGLRYKSVAATQYMAKTGLGVTGVHVSRKTIQWPFQKIKTVSLNPISYKFIGSNMSKEMVPFELPLTFTVSPKHPEIDVDGFIKYVTRLGDMSEGEIKNIIGGIVNGETRSYVGTMTIKEIFSGKREFQEYVVERVQENLDQFGLKIHNANIEEMHDTEGNAYFENLKQKELESALTTSRLAVSGARMLGETGEKENEVETRKQVSTLESEATKIETQQRQNMSDYERVLAITNTNNNQEKELAVIEARKMTESRRIQIESDLFKQEQTKELEKLRSSNLIEATAVAEKTIKEAEARAKALEIQADAQYYSKLKEAEGIREQLKATAEGLEKIYEVSHTNPELAHFYMALEKGVFSNDGLFAVMAKQQSLAIQGLEPKINIWNTGNNTESGFANVITDLAKTMPPILDVIQSQTNIKLPDFLKKTTSDYIKQ
ncbi:spfh domain-containing protein [Cotonvirus japonicus]|uniref:Spfh domain-containing protein n=1 Tax=Cotonvirus japonicus TaxID=2811091 RepID=A0ABM7NTK1_9VIRU|nr:spfh domain-containing protein [Cotonvirus japonicus]BCS83397.1 spfh domain-containing protein [Cotonvirus japonicus]